MAHSSVTSNHPVLARVGVLVVASSLALTLAFFGLIALATGSADELSGRVPFYVLAAAVTFAGALIGLDRRNWDGRDLLYFAVGLAVVAFVLFTLGLEGVVFAINYPGESLGSRRFLYLLSAAMVATGLGYWFVSHWAEFARSIRRSAWRTRWG